MTDRATPVLDAMRDAVINRPRKANAASVPQEAPRSHGDEGNAQSGTLTPVPLEVTGSVVASREAILTALSWMEAQANSILQEISNIRFTLDLLFAPLQQAAPVTPATIEADRKKAEAEADQRALERKQKEQAEAAQAATFAVTDKPPASQMAPEPDTWLCPTHGKSKWATSPKGRQYLRCPVDGCGEFERRP